ncbi:MAG: response regulator, partial [Desulfovibrionales bacterium]
VRHRAHVALVAAQESLEAKVRERTSELERANLRLQEEINERRAAEASLASSESRLRAAMESLPFDFFAIDESGRYVLENAASIRHWGSAIGKRPEDIAQGEILARWQENNCRAFAGETVQGEVRLTRNGKPKYLYNIITPIRIDGAITGILGVNIDITDQKRAELALGRAKEEMQQLVENRTAELTEVNKQLRNEILVREEAQEELHEREQEFRALVENAPDVIIRIDPQLRIVYANPAMQASTGYPREWFLDKSIEEIGLPAHRTRQISKILHSVFDSGQEQTITIEYPAADRSTKHFQLRFSPEHAPGGDRVESVLGIGRDISAMKELEARLRAANTAKNTFMANMSHELRTPLGGILGLVDLALSQDTTLPDDLKHDLNMIHESARSLLYIINDILDLSRIEAGKLELQDRDFDLKEMLELVLEPLAMQARAKGLRFHIELRPEIPPVIRADPFRLGQILKNLVSNAVKFTETGEVLVQVVNRSRPGCERHRLAFSVIDTGIGIAPSDQQKLFKSFCQLDASPSKKFGGAGLGLAISRELAACMGGDIELRSRKGKGCVFTFSAEFTSGAPVIPSPPEEEADRTGSPLRILLAEDNPVNSAYLVRFLRAEGHSVIVAKNGIEALEALGKERFDIVLMDVQMPQMDGVEATRRIRSARPEEINTQIPVIALTAYAMKGDRETFLQAGMNDYVPKPVDFNQLRSILSKFTATQGCS